MMVNLLILVPFPLAMAFAASSDLLTMTISNRLVLALTGAFFVLALALLILQFRSDPLHPRLNGYVWIESLHNKNTGVPYWIALAAAARSIYPDTVFMEKIVM